MNVFDIVLIVLAVSAAIGGYRLGFVARATSWLGLALGLVAGAFLLRRIVPEMQDAGQATKSLVAVGLLVGAGAGRACRSAWCSAAGSTRSCLPARRAAADRAAGGVIGVVGVLVGLWLLLAGAGPRPGAHVRAGPWLGDRPRGQ